MQGGQNLAGTIFNMPIFAISPLLNNITDENKFYETE